MENQNERDEIEIDLVELFYVLWGHVWLILSIGLFCALSCFALSKFVIAPTYKSTTKIYILNKSDSSSVTYSDVQLGTQLTKDYTELINSRYVLEAVIQELGLNMEYKDLLKKIDVTTPSDTRIVSITVEDHDPVVLNPHDDSLSVIGINRNTMTDVSVYDNNGSFVNTVKAQIAVQHGFGNGVEESCEYEVNAVQHLFYEMPIHGYAAINMDAIGPLTDRVGGIDLTALEDVKSVDGKSQQIVIKEGEQVHLDGDLAYAYVRDRNTDQFGSADKRLERQKQFITAYLQKVKQKTKADIGFPISVYQAVASRMVTDLTVDEMTYLVSIAKDYSFDENYLYTLKGETKQGDVFEEFYVDETDLFELILKIFYEPVEQ